MSWQPADEPAHTDTACAALDTVIVPRARDIGGFEVRRALPAAARQMVGPFIFFDQMGPAVFRSGAGLDVRPHPHIGLATVTYLFEGEILHRDSLGSVQAIRPGEVNLMTAGRGIAHSERTGPEVRAIGGALFGIQSWVALPERYEETVPAFVHHGADDLPIVEGEGMRVRLIAGALYGKCSPTRTYSDSFYADADMAAGARLALPAEHEERAIYIAEGQLEIAGDTFDSGRLLLFRPGDEIPMTALRSARVMLFGGEPMDGPRHIWWNFVSRSKDRIDQAKAEWKAGRFAAVPGETEFIPLPEPSPPPVHYP